MTAPDFCFYVDPTPIIQGGGSIRQISVGLGSSGATELVAVVVEENYATAGVSLSIDELADLIANLNEIHRIMTEPVA